MSKDGKPSTTEKTAGAAKFDAFLTRLAAHQSHRPWPIILLCFALGLISLPWISQLSLNSDFTSLLPDSAQSVRDLEEIQERFGGQQSMSITIESEDTEALHRFVRALAPRVRGLESHQVIDLDWNLSDFETFVHDNRHLYADIQDLRELRDVLDARLEYERAHANPFFLDLEEEEAPDPQPIIQRMQDEAEETRARTARTYPDGFFQHPTRSLVIMVVHTQINGGASEQVLALRAAVEAEIQALQPDNYADDIAVHFGGTLIDIETETASLVAAVRNATLLTITLVLLAIYIFFLRIRSIPLLGLALLPPVLVTFGIAEVTVDYLNASSAFLSSIVVGNGINPNVVWLARYFEARRDGQSTSDALRISHVGTWRGTLTAALAAAVAYGSLIVTEYRGFRDFGIIGGTGMILCWLAAYALLPSLVVVFERWRPLKFKRTKSHKGIYGVIFARIALASPKRLLALSSLLTMIAGVLVTVAVVNDPLEYDFRNLRSTRDPDAENEYVLQASLQTLNQTVSGSSLAILASRAEVVPSYVAHLQAYGETHPNIVGDVRSIDELLPAEQDEKIPLLADLRRAMLEIRPHLDEDDQAQVDEQLPPEHVERVTPEDIPQSVARPFSERDGTRGRLLFVESHPEGNDWDGQYLVEWASAARSLSVLEPEGAAPPVAGTAVVFADLNRTVWRESPRAVMVAFCATCLLLFMAFRTFRERWLTLGALLVGILWMAATMAIFGMKLNFLNFVAFPITFGNGVDYGVNVMRRYVEERNHGRNRLEAVRAAVEGTGGAVILCSMTTVIGYISLYTSSNQALNSFGSAMAISEVTCLAAAVLALPALLAVLRDPKSSGSAETSEPDPSRV